jgi:signal transduction histidine kinase
LGDTLDLALRPLEYHAKEKGLNLAWQIDADVPEFIRADPVRLGQVVTNLISNAFKFTEKGEVLVKVESCLTRRPRRPARCSCASA